MREMIEAGMLGWPGPKNNRDLLYSLAFTAEAHSWAIENVKSDEEMNRLSKTQKQAIISSLAGYCVQEKWDDFKGLLPDTVHELINEVLMEALVYKEIFGKLFMNPWWYLDGKMRRSVHGCSICMTGSMKVCHATFPIPEKDMFH